MRAYVLREVMLCRNKCLVLWEVMCWWSPCLQDGLSCNALCFSGRNFLLDDMFCLMVCILGGHVL